MKRSNLADRTRYKFDNLLSKGPGALIAGLGLIAVLIIVVAGAVISALQITQSESEPLPFFEAVWESLMRTLDAGTMGGDSGWIFRGVMFLVTLGGIFIVSTFIGVLSNGLSDRLDELRKGRSRVVERNHTVILGWSAKIFTIIEELTVANESLRRPVIVVLAAKDKVEMEDAIREHVSDTRGTKIVCRSGNHSDSVALAIANINECRSIIILGAQDASDPDIEVIKSLMAIVKDENRRKEPFKIVAEIAHPRYLQAARIVGGSEASFVLTSDTIARITAQSCRQAGLSVVYQELLDFDGDEVYFKQEPELHGRAFKEILFAYDKASIIGIADREGVVKLNPPMDTIYSSGDRLVAIVEDDSLFRLSSNSEPRIEENDISRSAALPVGKPENTLILAWNRRVPSIIKELDQYVPAGSKVTLVSIREKDEVPSLELKRILKNQSLTFVQGDSTDRELLESLELRQYDHVIIVCNTEDFSPSEAGARTLLTLIHVRDIAERDRLTFSLTSEVMDVQDRSLVQVMKVDDFIVSDHLTSLMLAQLSENMELAGVFADIFDAEGSEIYLKPIEYFVQPGRPITFATLIESAARMGAVAIGYKIASEERDASKAYGVTINPAKNDTALFSKGDKVILLSEH